LSNAGLDGVFEGIMCMMNDKASNVLIHQLGQELFLMRLSGSALGSDLSLDQERVKKNYDTLTQSIERATQSLQALVHLSTNQP
jgi:hypothetical protein